MAFGSSAFSYLGSFINIMVWVIVVVGLVAVVYYFSSKRKKKHWKVRIYEPDQVGLPSKKDNNNSISDFDSDLQRLRLVGTDRLLEKKNSDGVIVYYLEKSKKNLMPPSYEFVEYLNGKMYVDLLRKEDEYTYIAKGIDKNQIAKHYVMHYNTKTLMTLNIEERKKRYAKKTDFLQKWGHIMAIGLIVIMVIVSMTMTFDFVKGSMKDANEKMDKQIGLMDRLLQQTKSVSGGAKPNSAPNIK